LADRAFDVALHQIIAALEPVIEAFQDAACLIAGLTRAFNRDLIAA
jgi:hypothetical protein